MQELHIKKMSDRLVCEIRRIIFDSIEDANNLTQEHRIWLLDILETLTTTFYIRKSIANLNLEELDEYNNIYFMQVVEYVFEQYIK